MIGPDRGSVGAKVSYVEQDHDSPDRGSVGVKVSYMEQFHDIP